MWRMWGLGRTGNQPLQRMVDLTLNIRLNFSHTHAHTIHTLFFFHDGTYDFTPFEVFMLNM